MTQDKPAEWAMKAAQEVQDAILSMNPVTHSEYTAERIHIIARAIEAADKAATERNLNFTKRELQILRNIVDDHVSSEIESRSVTGIKAGKRIRAKIAAAIRKGGDNE